MNASTLASQLDAWCQSYVTAFCAYDVPAISAHWTFPATILVDGDPVALDSRTRFDRNTEKLCGFYRRQGVAHAERTLIGHMSMGEASAAIRVADRMVDTSGVEIVAWQAAYTLLRTPAGWRACLADAGGEMQAWAARGTPLAGR
jgi:hypothetical protein